MDKELDPLREIDSAGEREELPPTTELRKSAKPHTVDAPSAATPPPQSPQSTSGSRRNSPSSHGSRLPAVAQHPSGTHGRMRYDSQFQVSIRENIVPREHIRLYASVGPILTLFTLGLIVAFLGIGIVRSVSNNYHTPSAPTPPSPTAGFVAPDPNAIYPEENAFVEPLFGQFAVKQCADRCEIRSGPVREACIRGCSMYQISTYGRRVSFDRYDPAVDVTTIVDRCTKRNIELSQHTSGSAWMQDLSSSLSMLEETPDVLRSQDLNRYRSQYHRLLDGTQKLRLPPGGTAMEIGLTKDIVRAACLEANLALTWIAVASMQQSGDELSSRYYRQIAQGLEPRSIEATTRVIGTAKTMKLH